MIQRKATGPHVNTKFFNMKLTPEPDPTNRTSCDASDKLQLRVWFWKTQLMQGHATRQLPNAVPQEEEKITHEGHVPERLWVTLNAFNHELEKSMK